MKQVIAKSCFRLFRLELTKSINIIYYIYMANPKEGTLEDYQIAKDMVLVAKDLPAFHSAQDIADVLRNVITLSPNGVVDSRIEQPLPRFGEVTLDASPLSTVNIASQHCSEDLQAVLQPAERMSLEQLRQCIEDGYGLRLASSFRLHFIENGKIDSVSALTQFSGNDLLYEGQCGPRLLFALRSILAKLGLRLKDDLDGDPLTKEFFALIKQKYTPNLASKIANEMRRKKILSVRALLLRKASFREMGLSDLAISAIEDISSGLDFESDPAVSSRR